MSELQTVAIGFTTRLRYAYWLTGLVILVNVVISIMMYGPVAGGVLWDEVNEGRWTTLPFWWFWGQTLAFYAPFLTMWLSSHNWYGIYYAIHLVGIVIAIGIHIVFGVFVIDVFIKCTPRFCDGDQAISALNPKFGTAPDIALWAMIGILGVSFLCCIYYLVWNYYLHRKVEFRTQLEVASALRAPDMARSYMYRASMGGLRWAFDWFSPPGTHAYGTFSPYTGGANTMQAQIGAEHGDVVAHHGGVPAPTLDHLYSYSPWSILSHAKDSNFLRRIFSKRYDLPAIQFMQKGYTPQQLAVNAPTTYSPLPTTAEPAQTTSSSSPILTHPAELF